MSRTKALVRYKFDDHFEYIRSVGSLGTTADIKGARRFSLRTAKDIVEGHSEWFKLRYEPTILIQKK
jgi:hypothetical protein